MTLTFQQEAAPDFTKPWPVTIDSDARVLHGRPDAINLIGFQADKDVQEVNLFAFDTPLEELATLIIGMFPVFAAADGSGIFCITLAVTSATTQEG